MRKFNRNSGKKSGRRDSRGSGRSSGRNRRDPGRSGFEKQMHEVICDKCGQSCEVPFKPTSGKSIYCRDCFRKEDGSESGSRREGRRQDFRSGSRREGPSELQQINAKLHKILEMLSD